MKNQTKQALDNLEHIHKLAKEFSQFEMIKDVKSEIDEILELSNAIDKKYQENNDYENIMESFVQIQDNVSEIFMLTGDTIKELNSLREEHRDIIYGRLGINKIDEKDQGISENRQKILYKMIELTEEILDNFD